MLGRIAPGWALRRARARALLEAHYDGAARSRRTAGYGAGRGDANAPSARSIARLREVCRDLVRNDPTAKTAKKRIANHAVGIGITPRAVASAPAVADAADRLWKMWSKSLAADYDGRMKFVGLQHLVMRTMVESGGALVLRERGNSRDNLPVPVRIRVIEPDHIDHSRDNLRTAEGNPIIRGVETDGRGRRVAYWLYPEHPGSSGYHQLTSVRVPAEDVIHIYDVDRPGQMGGVPWMDAVVTALNDRGDYLDAVRMQAKVAAAMVGVVQDLNGSGTAFGEQDDEMEEVQHMEPGTILKLLPGQSITFNTPPQLQSSDFVTDTVRDVASAMGLTYESLSGDYRKATFSSARMARQEHRNDVNNWQQHLLIPLLCDGVWRWVMEMAAELEGWGEVPTANWSPPALPSVEPDKEAGIFQGNVRSGRKTPSEALHERGIDFEEHVEAYAREMKRLDDLGIVWDSDPRKVTGAGIKQAE